MLTALTPLIIGFLVTMTLMLALRPVASQFGMVDVPGGRKSHAGEVPVIGGIAMFLGLLVAVLAVAAFQFWPRPDPRESTEQIRVALLRHDLPAFEQHVELDRVLTDAIAQVASFAASEAAVREFGATPGEAAMAGATACSPTTPSRSSTTDPARPRASW